jgi:hypothetical protein
MERLVHSYLSQNYVLELEEIRSSIFLFDGDALYDINDDSKYRSFKNPSQLLSELNTVFFLTHDELKPLVLSWAIKIKEDVNLDRYWEYIQSLLPIAKQIVGQTIGLNLVAVQPMDGPRGELVYMDYQIVNNEPIFTAQTRDGRVYDEEVYRQSWGDVLPQLHENQQNHIVGELDHPTPEININDRDDSMVYSMLHKWKDIIGASSRRNE